MSRLPRLFLLAGAALGLSDFGVFAARSGHTDGHSRANHSKAFVEGWVCGSDPQYRKWLDGVKEEGVLYVASVTGPFNPTPLLKEQVLDPSTKKLVAWDPSSDIPIKSVRILIYPQKPECVTPVQRTNYLLTNGWSTKYDVSKFEDSVIDRWMQKLAGNTEMTPALQAHLKGTASYKTEVPGGRVFTILIDPYDYDLISWDDYFVRRPEVSQQDEQFQIRSTWRTFQAWVDAGKHQSRFHALLVKLDKGLAKPDLSTTEFHWLSKKYEKKKCCCKSEEGRFSRACPWGSKGVFAILDLPYYCCKLMDTCDDFFGFNKYYIGRDECVGDDEIETEDEFWKEAF